MTNSFPNEVLHDCIVLSCFTSSLPIISVCALLFLTNWDSPVYRLSNYMCTFMMSLRDFASGQNPCRGNKFNYQWWPLSKFAHNELEELQIKVGASNLFSTKCRIIHYGRASGIIKSFNRGGSNWVLGCTAQRWGSENKQKFKILWLVETIKLIVSTNQSIIEYSNKINYNARKL